MSVPVELPERFASGGLKALGSTVEERRASGTPVVFDARAVRSVDSAALQFLLVCHATRAASDPTPVLANTSDALAKALLDIGVTEPLDR